MQLTEEEWKKKLTPEQYHVLREKGTELPGTGKLLNNDKTGNYTCAACGTLLFKSDSKYESTVPGLIGWPSFAEAANNEAIELLEDSNLGMQRTEVICKNCGGHLGHLFADDAAPTGEHYCINSCSLDFEAKTEEPAKK